MPSVKCVSSKSTKCSSTAARTSSFVSNYCPPKKVLSLGNRWKSDGASNENKQQYFNTANDRRRQSKLLIVFAVTASFAAVAVVEQIKYYVQPARPAARRKPEADGLQPE
ncbi:hypothetical protein EVAR_39180_1 [Eumeta japonica]|uniref:Uncharacterized protein n=1 Tax=Eumeta variegata TaxID=151549 RepID=A0A4C1VNG5_EUMVA|nr:hypothetical protein EVAR_39180_1 [Eumeta japonica]